MNAAPMALKMGSALVIFGKGRQNVIANSLLLIVLSLGLQGTKADYERASSFGNRFRDGVFRTNVTPRWLDDHTFWYEVKTGEKSNEWVLVDAKTGAVERFPAQSELKKKLGDRFTLPVTQLDRRPSPRPTGESTEITFQNKLNEPVSVYWWNNGNTNDYGKVDPAGSRTMHTYEGHVWEFRDSRGTVLGYATARALDTILIDRANNPDAGSSTKAARKSDDTKQANKTVEKKGTKDQKKARPRRGADSDQPRGAPPSQTSPDGKWRISFQQHNLSLEQVGKPDSKKKLTTDGTPVAVYNGPFYWSPDSKFVVGYQQTPAQERKVLIVASSPSDQLQPKTITLDYLKPGDRIAQSRPVLIDVEKGTCAKVDNALFSNPWSLPGLDSASGFAPTGITWSADSSRFMFAYNQRGHQLMRVISVDAQSATPTVLFEDKTETFINYSGKFYARYFPKTDEILWMSERDGWNHLYLHDARTGKVIRQLTKGDWTVRGVESFNEADRSAVLRVAGMNPKEDPYHVHYVRVKLDDGSLTRLTEGDGTHRLTFTPNSKYYLDSYSRVDLPPVTELRQAADGKLVCKLESSDASALKAKGWPQPERFVAKGRDGKTDIYGVVFRPSNFDPNKKYPVIEEIYAGPQGYFVPKAWSVNFGNKQTIAELGFIVVQIDGMGTDGRSKAFHDVCFKNLKDAGFPDRIAWIKALGEKYSYLDLSRVGIFGGSAGGQNALAALIWHHDFYKVAVADCGCHDNRMDKIWWNEQWMSWPIDKSYEASSNVVNANKMEGKLLLVVGEVDSNVDPASTMQVANALVKADKDFDLLVIPGANHGAAESSYGRRRRMDFFVRHLLGKEPRS